MAAKVAAGEKSTFDVRAIPSVAYADPETAWVGLTETDAKHGGVEYHEAADDGFLYAIRQKRDCPGAYLRGFPLFVPVLASIHH